MTTMQQLPLHFPVATSYLSEDFLVSDCNREAWHALQTWASGAPCVFLLRGSQASGKTHLATMIARQSQAQMLDAEAMSLAHDPAEYFTESQPLVIENIETATPAEPLFHLLNHLKQQPYHCLLTVAESACWDGFTLPDLRSRLQALPQAAIESPDDDILAALLVKHFTDRQIAPPQGVIEYLLKRMERSFTAVKSTVAELDKLAISQKKPISVALARQLLTDS